MKASDTHLADFIARWSASGGSEQANAQLFLAELCDVLGVARPAPATPINEENVYSFERKVFVPKGDGSSELKRLDLYKQGCFVLEAKQGKEVQAPLPFALPLLNKTRSTAVNRGTRPWEDAMIRAKRQAESYVRSLPAGEGRPPFVIVADIGHCFDVYSEFSCTGGMYIPFPDARTTRIYLRDLVRQDVLDTPCGCARPKLDRLRIAPLRDACPPCGPGNREKLQHLLDAQKTSSWELFHVFAIHRVVSQKE